jgi:hypothetical protein
VVIRKTKNNIKYKIYILLCFILFFVYSDISIERSHINDDNDFTIYIPSTGDIEKDSLNIVRHKRKFGRNKEYIIFYLKDPSKNYEKWKTALAGIESGGWTNQYESRRVGSQYWGKYQMGEFARKKVGMDGVTWENWRDNPELQEIALNIWIDILYKELEKDIKKYDGTFVGGWYITESGIIAMAHNVGGPLVKSFLYSGGVDVPKDGSGKDATRFLILGNYDLEIKK